MELYEFPDDYVGRKSYVSVRGHSKSVPKYKTYKGTDGYNYLLPDYGGDWSGIGEQSSFILPDKQPYLSPLDGSYITSRSHHREHMIRHNVIEAGDLPVSREQSNRDAHRPVSGRDIADAIRELGGH